MQTILFSTSTNAVDKKIVGNISEGWKPGKSNLNDLIACVKKGYPINAAILKNGKREDANFVKANLIIFDIDNGRKENGQKIYDPKLSVTQALSNGFIKKHCLYAYTSPSHIPQWHKFRLILPLSETVDNINIYKRIIRYVAQNIEGCDRNAMSGTNIFFGNTKAIDLIVNPDAIEIDVEALYNVFAREDKDAEQLRLERQKTRSQQTHGDRNPVDWARYYLSFIKPDRADDYNQWIAVGMALKSIDESLFPDWCDWSSQQGAFKGEKDCQIHWRGSSFVKDTPEEALAKLGKWSKQDGRESKPKREKVSAVRKKLENDYTADPEKMLDDAIAAYEKAIAAKDELDDEYLTLKNQALEDPLDATLKAKAAAKKEELRLAAEKIRNLRSNRAELRMQINRIRKEELSQRRDEEKDTPFRKDRQKILELLQGKLRYNTLKHTIEYEGEVRFFEETRAELSKLVGYDNWHSSDEGVFKLLLNLAKENSFCPFQEYLEEVEKLEHDHTYLDTLAQTVYGTTDPLQNEYLKRTLIGAVRRTYEPGCPHPYVLILYSKSRWSKSHSIAALFGDEYTGAGLISMDDKDSIMTLNKSIVHELPEVDKIFNQKDSSTMKSFITITTDTYRPPYGRAVIQNKRRTILIGTTNHNDFLNDETGNKRYLILELGHEANTDYLYGCRDAIWAAAMDGYRKGISNELPNETMQNSEERNKDFLFEDVWTDAIVRYTAGLSMVATEELLTQALKIDIGRITKVEQNRVAKTMRTLGWEYKLVKISGQVCRRWRKEVT